MKKYKVLVAFDDYKVGDIVEFSAEEAAPLLEADKIEVYAADNDNDNGTKAIVEEMTKKFTDVATSVAQKAASDTLRAINKGVRGMKAPFVGGGESEEDKLIKTGGFKHFGQFCKSVMDAGREPNELMSKYVDAAGKVLKASGDGINTAVDSEGGFLVPIEYRDTLLTRALEEGIIRKRSTTIPMGASQVEIPAMVDNNRTSSLFGGVQVYREKEAGQYTSTKPAFRKVGLKLNKLIGLCYVTDEMLSDSPQSAAALIDSVFPSAMSYREDTDYLSGTGAGEPQGVLNSAATIVITKETGQDNATVVYANILKMYARMHWASHGEVIWIANHNVFPQLASLVIPVGTGGVPVWLPGNDISKTPHGTILGIPLILTEHVPTLGEEADIGLYKFKQYLVGEKSGEGLQTASSIHLKFDYGQTAYRFTMRDDGQSWWDAPLTPKNGDTLSPFVVLGERK